MLLIGECVDTWLRNVTIRKLFFFNPEKENKEPNFMVLIINEIKIINVQQPK